MARWTDVERGRTLVATLEPGDDVVSAMRAVCAAAGVSQGVVPVFSGAFRTVELIGGVGPIDDEDAPLAASTELRNVEGLGSGTITTDGTGTLELHLHLVVGDKARSASASAGHVLAAVVQYPVEVVIDEVLSPRLSRDENPSARGLRTLSFP